MAFFQRLYDPSHSSAVRLSLDETPTTEGSGIKAASPNDGSLIPVSLTVHRAVQEQGGHGGERDHEEVALDSIPVVSTSDALVSAGGGGEMISGAKMSECGTPVTLTLQNPDGQGEDTVVAAQIAKVTHLMNPLSRIQLKWIIS